ncbi:MAG: PTS sugar transporter subunit IIA [Polyangiaceae bacterium]|nr:PTS sugar transporter subunit IIA [Polyangiaceae bacterium]
MRISSILPRTRVSTGAKDAPTNKAQVIHQLAELLTRGSDLDRNEVERQLLERETVLSTGIGEGVAIPHTSIAAAKEQTAALLIVPHGVDFESCDGAPATIFFGVIGPKQAASEHLKILAKVSKLLRKIETRRRLLESTTAEQAHTLILEHEKSELGPVCAP